ncbi:hypothetical protein ACE6H2_015566 [Prunus campanulata]
MIQSYILTLYLEIYGSLSRTGVRTVHGSQNAVVVSIDPHRVYLKNPEDVGFKTIRVTNPGKGA